MKDQLLFDFTDSDTKTDSDKVMAALVDSSLNEITSGDGDSDDLVTTAIRGIDSRAFNYAFDGTNWDRLRATSGALHVDIQDSSITVVAGAEKAEDSAHSSGDTGNFVLGVRQDTLAASTDADGDYAAFKFNNVGELYTTDEGAEAILTTIDADTGNIATDTAAMVVDLAAIEVLLTNIDADTTTIAGDTTSIDNNITALTHDEDAAHSSGDKGVMPLAVRQDTLATLSSADGDYTPLKVNDEGRLYVTIDTDDSDAALANVAIENTATTVGVAITDLVATDLANRKYAYLYNNSNRRLYVGKNTGLTTANGFPVSPGSTLELRAGSAINISAISPAAGKEMRILELS